LNGLRERLALRAHHRKRGPVISLILE
jgi:hypothetical protein